MHPAGRLADRLATRFGPDEVFMDVATIEPGVDFSQVITRAAADCQVLLVLIGKQWLKSQNGDGSRRLDDPSDYVVLEIKIALQREIRIIPVLIDGAAMPRLTELPESIRGLALRHAVHLDHESFSSDSAVLVSAIAKALREAPNHSVGDPAVAPLETSFAGPAPTNLPSSSSGARVLPMQFAQPDSPSHGRSVLSPPGFEPVDFSPTEPLRINSPRKPVPVHFVIIRIILWWLCFAFAVFAGVGLGLTLAGKYGPDPSTGIVGSLILAALLAGALFLLRKVIVAHRAAYKVSQTELARSLTSPQLRIRLGALLLTYIGFVVWSSLSPIISSRPN